MTKLICALNVMLILGVQAACAGSPVRVTPDLGRISIGSLPSKANILTRSDCSFLDKDFADCQGTDHEGLQYVFFGGALSKVTAEAKKVSPTFQLPLELKFGHSLSEQAERLSAQLAVQLDRVELESGEIIYSSDFVLTSRSKVKFSIELSGHRDTLERVEYRTDF